MEKYFTPDIEDIRVGYELEYHNSCTDEAGVPELNYDKWEATILQKGNVETILKYGLKSTRVPYLTKEQVEAEGWFPFGSGHLHIKYKDRHVFQKDNYFLILHLESEVPFVVFLLRDPSLEERMGNPERWSVCLDCRDINDFRYINKLLKFKQ